MIMYVGLGWARAAGFSTYLWLLAEFNAVSWHQSIRHALGLRSAAREHKFR